MTKAFKIVVLPGDGIGPEVVAEGVKVLRSVEQRFGHTFNLEEHIVGGRPSMPTGRRSSRRRRLPRRRPMPSCWVPWAARNGTTRSRRCAGAGGPRHPQEPGPVRQPSSGQDAAVPDRQLDVQAGGHPGVDLLFVRERRAAPTSRSRRRSGRRSPARGPSIPRSTPSKRSSGPCAPPSSWRRAAARRLPRWTRRT